MAEEAGSRTGTSSGSGQVLYEERGHVRLITINRPERMNAIGPVAARGLREAFGRFREDPEARVAVLTGAGDAAFSAGADLESVAAMYAEGGLPGVEPLFDPRRPLTDPGAREGMIGPTRWTDLHKPVIAAVNGAAYAGGLEWACFAHIRIADEHSSFGVTCRRWNVGLGDGGTQRLPRIVGMGRAMELIITGRVIGAREALAMGLVNEVTSSGACVERALDLADEVSRLPQGALRTDMEAALRGWGEPLERGLEIEAACFNTLLEQPELAGGAERFLKREHPDRAAGARPLSLTGGAHALAKSAHRRQTLKDGETPYVQHPVNVASLVAQSGGDEAAIAGAYLHDVVEKTDVSLENVEDRFGEEVARIVGALTEDTSIDGYVDRKRDLRRRAMAAGHGARLIYVSDKLDNVRELLSLRERRGEAAYGKLKVEPELRLALWREDVEGMTAAPGGLEIVDRLSNVLDELAEDLTRSPRVHNS